MEPETIDIEPATAERFAEGATGGRLRLPAFRRFRRTASPDGAIPEGQPGRAVSERDARYRRGLGAADVLAAAFALTVGVVVIGDDQLALAALVALPFTVLVSKTIGLYDRDEYLLRKTTLDEAPRLFQVATLYALVLWLLEDLFVIGNLGREQVLGIWLLSFGSMVALRAGVRWLSRASTSPERCLVLGDQPAAEHLARKLSRCGSLKANVVASVPLQEQHRAGDVPLGAPSRRGSLEALTAALVEHDVQRVIIAPETARSGQVLEAIRLLKSLGVKVSVLPGLFEVVGSSVEFDNVDGTVVLGLRRHGLTQSSNLLKRATDIAGSIFALTVLAPVFVAIAAAVKLTSSGPILFRQSRIGRGGATFGMLKFRTMVDGAEAMKADLLALNETDGLFKIDQDPRLTRVGRFLRRASLDELPQLLNVLRGQMSLVGPRPLVLEEDRLVHGWQRRRLVSAPGMTGLWQIFGSSKIPLEEMVKIDYLYGANWSLWLDTKILLRTIPYVLARRGM